MSQTPPLKFSENFPQTVGNFSPNYTRPLYVPIYAGLQIFIQLFATVTKLCQARPPYNMLKMSTIDRIFEFFIPAVCIVKTVYENALLFSLEY